MSRVSSRFVNIASIFMVFVCLAAASLSTQADVYKTVDEFGNVTYSDTPPDGETAPTQLPPINVEPSVTPRVKLNPEESDTGPLPIRISMVSPANESTVLGSAEFISVSASLDRPLEENEAVQLFVNGNAYGSPRSDPYWQVGGLVRGEYSLSASVLYKSRTIASTRSIRVYVKRNIAR